MWSTSQVRHPDRLRRMVSLLERDAANPTGVRFDLGTWAAPAHGSPHWAFNGTWNAEVQEVPVSCGTRACAVGLAAISGEFRAEGLSYRYMGTHDSFMLVPTFPNPDPEGLLLKNFEAAAELFGIDGEAAEFLFDPSFYATCPEGATGEMEVVERIEQFIADGRYNDDPDEFLDRVDDDSDEDEEDTGGVFDDDDEPIADNE